MEKLENLRSKRIATALAVAVGVVGIAGCGSDSYNESPSQGILRLEKDGTLYAPGESDGKTSTFSCQGNVLRAEIEDKAGLDDAKNYLNDPLCSDGKITPADFALGK
jgi:hypothetical protein